MSLFKASEVTEDDVLLLHGDLIFSEEVINNLIKDNRSRVIVDSAIPLPEKDFKARVERKNGKILEIDVNLKGDNLIASQPLYKLNKMDWLKWMDAIKLFCKQGNTNVYAELALNTITDRIDLSGYDIKGQLCMEIDNEDDLNRIKKLV
jgi:phosphoenolpyruvate phosphomutase